MEHQLNYIDGKYVDGTAQPITVLDPSNGQALSTHAAASAPDIDQAVKAARRAFEGEMYSALHPKERSKIVAKMGEFLAANANEIAQGISAEQGKPLFEAEWETTLAVRHFEYCSAMAESLEGKSVPCENTRFDFTTLVPHGVSAHFLPSHYPMYIAARSLAPALVTGNSCVLKTAEIAPRTAHWLVAAGEAADLPPGILNVLCGRRHEAGTALAAHPDIDHVVFIGNKASASEVMSLVAQNSRAPSIVEVGGTSPTIFFEDGNMDAFIAAARTGTYLNAGQFCTGMYRIIVHESRRHELLERSKELAESLSVGPGRDSGPFGPYMGPLDSEEQLDLVRDRVEKSLSLGAKCVTGGDRLPGPGSFYAPTVLTDVTSDMPVSQEEIFGPVMAVLSFETEEQAIKLANGVRDSGMSCSVFTDNVKTFMRSAKSIKAGHIISNASIIGQSEIPFGGYGRAGHGLLKGRDALLGYTRTKNILVPF